jgi:hypothetical protein
VYQAVYSIWHKFCICYSQPLYSKHGDYCGMESVFLSLGRHRLQLTPGASLLAVLIENLSWFLLILPRQMFGYNLQICHSFLLPSTDLRAEWYCCRIYQAVGRMPHLLQCLGGHDDCPALRCMFIEPLTDLLGDMHRFQDMVESTLDMDQVDRGEFLVKPSFDDDLKGTN